MKGKTYVLGIDCLDYYKLNEWIEQGRLPMFKKFKEHGILGKIDSKLPISSAASWTTIITGRNPGKHGIFAWNKVNPITGKNEPEKLNNSIPTIWQILNNYGYSFGGGGFPLNYPIKPMNGFIIPGDDIPRKEIRNYCYPIDLYRRIKEKYDLDFALQPRYKYDVNYFNSIIEFHRERMKFNDKLIKEYPCDIYFFVYTIADYAQHYGMNKEDLMKIYQEIDSTIAEFWESHVKEEDVIILLSDHGGKNVNRLFAVDKWLNSIGLLKYKTIVPNDVLDEVKINYILEKLINGNTYPIKKKRDETTKYLLSLWHNTNNTVREDIMKLVQIHTDEGFTEKMIDFDSTVAFGAGLNNSIYINDIRRFPYGKMISNIQKRDLVRYIKNELKSIVDPETGRGFISNVWEPHQKFAGPFVGKAADIYFEMIQENAVALSYGYRDSECGNIIYDVSPPYIGIHTHSAFYAMLGRKINHIDTSPVIVKEDILINILYLLGIPISRVLDGKIYSQFFKENKCVEYISDYGFQEENVNDSTDVLEESIIEQIKKMGYMR